MGDTAEKIPLNTGGAKPKYNAAFVERAGADSLRPEKGEGEGWKTRLDGTALVVGPSAAVDEAAGEQKSGKAGTASSKAMVLALEDVVGCEVKSGSVLVVHSYPRAVGCCGGEGGRRGHAETRFAAGSGAAVAFWHREIMFAVRCGGLVGTAGRAVPRRNVLVLVNPCSGAGLAPKLFEDEVEPVLKHAQLDYHLHVTTCQGDGEALVRKVKLGAWAGPAAAAAAAGAEGEAGEAASTSVAASSETVSEAKTSAGGDGAEGAEAARIACESAEFTGDEQRSFDTVLVVSGDGLLYEAVQGIMARPDWREAIKVSLCIAPGGSANGLSMSVLHRCGEAYGGLEAAFVCAKGVPMPFDISSTFSGPEMLNHTCEFGVAGVGVTGRRLRFEV